MKKICAAILAFVLLLGLTGCNSGRDALTSLDDITDEMLVSGELDKGGSGTYVKAVTVPAATQPVSPTEISPEYDNKCVA